jgi:mycothiol synthase
MTLDDAEAYSDLRNAYSLATMGVTTTTPVETRNAFQTPGVDLARDGWLAVTATGRVVALADVFGPEPYTQIYGDGCVHPDFQGRGIGTHLMRLAEARALELASAAPPDARVVLINRALSTDASAVRFLEDTGHVLSRHFWEMKVELDEEPPTPEWPAGITVRAAVPGRDERAAYAAFDEAFRDHYNYQSMPFETYMSFKTRDPENFDLSLWFLALDGDEIAGICLCAPHANEDPTMGWVDDLGVRRPWRRRGLGLALLRHALRAFRARGQRRVGLAVDAASLTGATRLYERAGMRAYRQWDNYQKELRPGREPAEQPAQQ